MVEDGLVGSDRVRRRLLRQSAGVLVFVLGEHRELPVLTWTVTPDVLCGHADVCEVGPGPGRQVFAVWADALPASEGCDPVPVLDESGVTRLRANRRVNGVQVVVLAVGMRPRSRLRSR
jgi:hypothetical protein